MDFLFRLRGNIVHLLNLEAQSTNDRKHSPLMVKEAFARNALFLCLNLLGEFESSLAQELLHRDLNDWFRCIIDGVKQLQMLTLPHHLLFTDRKEIELQILSLLREIFCVSGGTIANQQNRFNPGSTDLTPLDIMILYGLTCGVRTATPQQFGTSDLHGIHKALSRSRIFVQVTGDKQIRSANVSEVKKWSSQLKRSLPIAPPNLVRISDPMQRRRANKRKALPPQLWDEFGFRQMKFVEVFWSVFHS